jgi:hypothetical protein
MTLISSAHQWTTLFAKYGFQPQPWILRISDGYTEVILLLLLLVHWCCSVPIARDAMSNCTTSADILNCLKAMLCPVSGWQSNSLELVTHFFVVTSEGTQFSAISNDHSHLLTKLFIGISCAWLNILCAFADIYLRFCMVLQELVELADQGLHCLTWQGSHDSVSDCISERDKDMNVCSLPPETEPVRSKCWAFHMVLYSVQEGSLITGGYGKVNMFFQWAF